MALIVPECDTHGDTCRSSSGKNKDMATFIRDGALASPTAPCHPCDASDVPGLFYTEYELMDDMFYLPAS